MSGADTGGATDWERLGGEAGVRALVQAFVDRFYDDPIIGFQFEGRDRERIVRHEVELASIHLGGDLGYKGRGIASTHAPLRINKGQLRRRLALLRQELLRRGAPEDVVDRWVAHERRLESVITDGTDCVPSLPDDS